MVRLGSRPVSRSIRQRTVLVHHVATAEVEPVTDHLWLLIGRRLARLLAGEQTHRTRHTAGPGTTQGRLRACVAGKRGAHSGLRMALHRRPGGLALVGVGAVE